MANNVKKGLGRGLNSLLSGSMEEATPMETTPNRVRVEVEESATIIDPLAAEEGIVVEREIKQHPSTAKEDQDKKDLKTNISAIEEKKNTDEVDIKQVEPNPDQPRTNFDKEELEELASSIKKDGLLQPILVRPLTDNKYQIIAGERRWQASQLAGLKKVPIRIKEANDDEALELALIENIQRSDLNPIEEAYGYRRMMERRKMTQAEVAQAVSKGRSTVANALRLLELPEDAQQLLFEDKITAGHARAILSIPSKEGRQKLTDKLVQEKLSVREAEAIARLLAGKKNTNTSTREPMPKMFKTVARNLRESLQTNVRVKSVKGKNKIEIEFKDEDDLQRLFEYITHNEE
ncbi:ParB/RepB/Spo0J family partition protein [Eggerthellaceae bacterium 3-80]